MPGFKVPSSTGSVIGDRSSPDIGNDKPFYTYTWTIDQLFGDNVSSSIYAKDATLPSITHRRDEVEGSSLIYKYAKDVIWEDCRVVFYDIMSNSLTITARLEDWRNRVWDVNRGIGVSDGESGYKRNSTISKQTYDLAFSESWILKGSWPQAIRYGELTYTDSQVNIVDVVICYDWAERTYLT